MTPFTPHMENQFVKTKEEISTWLEGKAVCNYTLLPHPEFGYVVDVAGGVSLSMQNLRSIPVKFNRVEGSFVCANNYITDLSFAPTMVKGMFKCNNNRLTSLEGCPEVVESFMDCSYNRLTSLKGMPREIGGGFNCSYNALKSLQYCAPTINGNFDCSHNKITTLEFGPDSVSSYYCCLDNPLLSLEFFPSDVKFPMDFVGCQALGDFQYVREFAELFKEHQKNKIIKEKELLEKTLALTLPLEILKNPMLSSHKI